MAINKKIRLGEALLSSKAITKEQLENALTRQSRDGSKLGRVIVSMGLMTAQEIINAVSLQLGTQIVDLSSVDPSPGLIQMVPESIARKYTLFPFDNSNGVVRVAMADPQNLAAVDELSARLSNEVETFISTEDQITSAINKYYGVSAAGGYDLSDAELNTNMLREGAATYARRKTSQIDKAPIANIVEAIIRQAVAGRASDIHIEPLEKRLRIRCRIDGVMFPAPAPPKKMEQAIASRVKIIAGMDIAETRIPQDGGFTLLIDGKKVEFRVSTFPTIYGESVVIRILDRRALPLNPDELGLCGKTLSAFNRAVSAKSGIIIVTGPTGSGKTTTLYSAVSAISSPEKTLVTIEDPVEYRLNYVRQTQINPKAGLTFAKGLRSMLRQDPDVIMVGEIRDQETAAVATQAAMTGHMVLTTMHTSDAAGAITRMMDLGVEPYKIASTFAGVLGQRLVRRICENCRMDGDNENRSKAERGNGCPACKDSGYKGRVGIYEFLAADDGIRELILSRATSPDIRARAIKNQAMETMREDGLKKAAAGITTKEEVMNVVSEGDI